MAYDAEQPVRGFIFWSLSPFLVMFIVLMPFLVQNREPGALVTLTAIETLAILVFVGLAHPTRFWWAWRGVGAIVFLVYLAYLIAMLIESDGKIVLPRRKSESSAFNAICGLIVFGLPGLCYALFGRLKFWKEKEEDSADDFEDEFDDQTAGSSDDH